MMKVIDDILTDVKFEGNFCVIGIDGPTASGKTTLADCLGKKFDDAGILYFIYRLDWTLIERRQRHSHLESLFAKDKLFEYEADLHMDLTKARDFLDIIENERYNDLLSDRTIHLESLYNREDEGKCTGSADMILKKNMIIVVEGHYTHHHILRRYFDFNYMLIAEPDELLRRKIERSSAYATADKVKKYFSLIDLPSFAHNYYQNISFINRIFLNNTITDQKQITHKQLQSVLLRNIIHDSSDTGAVLVPECFPGSDLQKNKVNLFMGTLAELHDKLLQLWGIHPQYRKSNFKKQVELLIDTHEFKLIFSSLYWQKSNSFSYEIGFFFYGIYVIVSGNLRSIQVLLASKYTKRLFCHDCNANGMTTGTTFRIVSPDNVHDEKQYVIAPNKFLVPDYLKSFPGLTRIYYGVIEDQWTSAETIFFKPSFFVLKANCLKQLDFYSNLLRYSGYKIVRASDYLFANALYGRPFTQNFMHFFKRLPQSQVPSEFKYKGIESEYTALEKFGCSINDGQLVFNNNADADSIIEFYKNASRIIKNKLTLSLAINYSNQKIYSNIRLDRFVRNLPVPCQEFYFALSVSGNGAIPFISLYHPTDHSVDIQTYLNYFSKQSRPFGIQASMNALGTENNNGYLKICGPQALAKIIKDNLISFLETNPDSNLSVWGIGVDHTVYDKSNKKKVSDFIREALNSQWYTSYCIDASPFLRKTLTKNSLKSINDFIKSIFLIIKKDTADLEFYIGNEQFFDQLPIEDTLSVYEKLAADFNKIAVENNRNEYFLLGPFLGTLHHRLHKNVNLELSEKILAVCFASGFLGNVLHGTSYTPYDQIRALIKKNCIRINYAGKLLETIINALPNEIRLELGNSQNEWKQNFAVLSHEMIEASRVSITRSLNNILQEIDDSTLLPEMTDDEINWFRNDNVCLPDEEFSKVIKDICFRPILKKAEIAEEKHFFLASMIEVPYSEFAGGLAVRIINAGITNFHIDIGDGKLISRNLDGFEKLAFIGRYYKNVNTHVHLMVNNPFTIKDGNSYISKVGNVKPSLIYLHTESFSFVPSWKHGSDIIIQSGNIPGIVLAVNEKTNIDSFLSKMKFAGIHNILVMGVPIGRGGQNFNLDTINRIEYIRSWSVKNDFEIYIEVDGGLSDTVIPDCINAGVRYLSGWSMFLKYGINNIEKRINELLNG